MLETAPLNRFPATAGQRFSNGALSGGPVQRTSALRLRTEWWKQAPPA